MPAFTSGLIVLAPNLARLRAAITAASCAGLAVTIGSATGHADTGLVASTGSLAALYAADSTPRREAAHVAAAAAVLSVSLAAGALATGPWSAVVITTVWTALVAYGCAALATRPPGAMMFILMCTLGTVLPGSSLAAIVATAATGIAAAALSTARPRRSEQGFDPLLHMDTNHARFARAQWSLNPKASPLVFMATRSACAVALAGSVAVAVDAERPYWAMAATAAVLGRGNQAATTILRAGQRLTGTLVGCLVAGLVLLAHPRGLVAALILAALTFATELFVTRNYALAMAFVTPMALLLTDAAGPALPLEPLLASRAGETLLGCAAAVAASQVVTRRWAVRHQRHALRAVERLTEWGYSGARNPRQIQERAGSLAGAVHRLETVTTRTAAERRGIRESTQDLRLLSDQALIHARTLLNDLGQQLGTASSLREGALSLPGEPSVEGRPT
ncbi:MULTISPECIES: FUSC family protein [Streptomyces]|uniref:FUSC family protein n=1 Tax=Streptomyces glycanivorans TaxID=3033808 RepID=A0ABY9J6S0_9ACTN|nr:FUSC family protein [Streptomyces sp. Alt3]WLQ63471.1 FUSC family protein [Streptomyces sp. Alt3]